MKPKFIKTAEKKRILQRLNKLYGISSLPKELLELQNNQIRAFSGNLNKSDLRTLSTITKIDNIGLSIIDNDQGDLKLTFDSLNILDIKKLDYLASNNQISREKRGRFGVSGCGGWDQDNPNGNEIALCKINNEQLDQWLKGQDLDLSAPKGTLLLQHEEDIVGIAKSTGTKVFNSVPKERKIKTAIK